MIETFGRLLKPNILEAIRQELDPTFQEGDLSSVIKSMLAGSGPPEGRKQASPGKPTVPASRSRPPSCRSLPARILPSRYGFPAPGEAPEGQDLMERLIRIIMDATGFNRDEIQPDMDLRRDLSIRSSRLPIIMDAAERQFGITIELEDFIDVRTVKDIAQRISKVIARQGGAGLQPATKAVDPDPVRDEILKSSEDEASLKRLVFNHATVESGGLYSHGIEPGRVSPPSLA